MRPVSGALMDTQPLFLDGEFVDSAGPARLEVVDPSTTAVIATVPDASPADVDRAVGAARRAFEGPWRKVSPQERGRILFRIAADPAGRTRISSPRLESRNSGKPIVEAESDIEDAATCFEYYGGMATKIQGDVVPAADDALVFVLREPVGVAAQIIPWNYPLLMAAWKLAPALCAGCTVVLKPAEETPLSILQLARHFVGRGTASRRRQHPDGPGREHGRRARQPSGRGQDCVHRAAWKWAA